VSRNFSLAPVNWSCSWRLVSATTGRAPARLVLLDFPDAPPGSHIEHSQLSSPSELGPLHVRDYFDEVLNRFGFGNLEDAVEQATAVALEVPDGAQDARLAQLAARLTRITAELTKNA